MPNHRRTRGDDRQTTGPPRVKELSRSVAHVDVIEVLGAAILASAFAVVARRAPRLAAASFGCLVPLVLLAERFGRRSGLTDDELNRSLPGDDLVDRPRIVMDRGSTFRAPADEIWPWIVQMGYHRGGWYTNYWLDKLVWHIDNPSVDRIVPELQHLRVGDIVPDGPPGSAYWKVAVLQPGRAIVYLDDVGTHVPGAIASWAIILDPIDEQATRVVTRTRATFPPSLVMELLARLLIQPADLLMTGMMVRGIKRRAERMGRCERHASYSHPVRRVPDP